MNPTQVEGSKLRPFTVRLVEVEFDGWVYSDVFEVTCGWCRTPFIVLDPDTWFQSKRKWLNRNSNRGYVGRSCPYCYRTGRIPSQDPRKEQ